MFSFRNKLSGSTRRVTFGLSIIQLFKAFLSFFTVIISSTYFGTTLGRDVWLLSLSISLIIGALIFGPIFEIFRAKFVMIKEIEGEENALNSVGSLLTYIIIISSVIVIISEIFPAILGKTFAPTYTQDQHISLNIMIRLIMPMMLFSLLVSIISAVLNVYNVFYVTELMAIFSSLLNVAIIILFAPTYGIYSLVLSGYLSNIILIAVLIYIMNKNSINLHKHLNLNIKPFIVFFKFALPFYFNYLIAQILLAAEKIISTVLGIGSLSVLDYARKFVSIPISVIQSTVNIVLTTTLTKKYIVEGEKEFLLELNKFIDLVVFATLPLVAVFVICPTEIVKVFLLRGAFDHKYIEPTANALFWFGFSIISIVFYSSNSQALLAQSKNKISALISGTMGFFVLGINLLFYKKYGIQLLAFSWTFTHLFAGLIMHLLLSKKEFKYLITEVVRKIFLLSVVLFTTKLLYGFINHYSYFNNRVVINSLITLTLTGGFSLLLEIIFINVLNFKERTLIKKYIFKRVFKY